MLVKKCPNGEVCEIFDNFFETGTHKKTTRNNGFLLQVPKLTKSCFRAMGVKFYNSLPIEHRQAEFLYFIGFTGYFLAGHILIAVYITLKCTFW